MLENVELERDLKLGLYEYVPQQVVTADKRRFESQDVLVFAQGRLYSAVDHAQQVALCQTCREIHDQNPPPPVCTLCGGMLAQKKIVQPDAFRAVRSRAGAGGLKPPRGTPRQILVGATRNTLPIGQPLMGHTKSVTSVAISAGGTRIVSGSLDNTVRLWDARAGAPIGRRLTGHTHSVSSVAISANGTRIVSGSLDDTVRQWDARTGHCIKVHEGTSDIRPFLERSGVPRMHLASEGLETRLVSSTGDIIAWFGEQLVKTASSPDGRTFVGCNANHVFILEWVNGFPDGQDEPPLRRNDGFGLLETTP
jgi:hypothetical protein